jgi:asparagine synthase (glutamine-hydrolysing)
VVPGGVVSGIAGIVLSAGRSVDERLLRRMTTAMAYRGPDGQQTWIAGSVGFAHALLRTGDIASAAQPATLDGDVWITADARIDGRADLVRKLEAGGRTAVPAGDDACLILHAYHVWGEHCVDHLLGDFAFAIWDERSRRLFCARDHFGVKPFYYAAVEGGIVFSNTLGCVRLHPEVGHGLNEMSVADFLLFGCHHDPTATTFTRIQRLPPAHAISHGGGTAKRRYWSLPAGGRIRYRKPADYVDHFRALLRDAVGDRIRDSRPAIWLSGGMDSTAIAATAQRVLTAGGVSLPLRAYTVVYESLFDDDERRYAEIAAREIGVCARYLPADDGLPFDGWDADGVETPEPSGDPYSSLYTRHLREMAAGSRVALSGDGGDEVFWRSYVVDLIGNLSMRELAADLARSVLVHRQRPAAGVRAKLQRWRVGPSPQMAMPVWLNAAFVDRHDLRRRFEEAGASSAIGTHALRPDAHRRLSSPLLCSYLEGLDPGITRVLLEHRWPFLDVRLVEYLLAIPPLPWCIDKRLLRVAMRGAVPETVLSRPKTPLANDPLRVHLRRRDFSQLDRFEAAPQLSRFVDRGAIPTVAGMAAGQNSWMDLRPLCLNYWLSRLNRYAS